MMRFNRWWAALFTLCLLVPLPHLLLRQSASASILGRYSPVYALVLLAYGGYALLWLGALAARARHGRFYTLILGRLWRLLALQALTIALFLVLSFLLTIWRLPFASVAATLAVVGVGPIGWLLIAPSAVRARWWREGLLMWVSLGFSLALVEILFRILVPYGLTPDPIWLDYGRPTAWRQYTGWSWRDNGFFYAPSPDEFLMPISINSHGLRERDYPHEKPPETYRILVIGDSFTYAQEVPLERTWHELLEARLNQSSERPIEIIAAGVGGWSTDQELLYLRHEGCRYQPDLVLLQFTLNDPSGNSNPNLPKPYFSLSPAGELTLERFPYALESDPYEGQLLVNHLIIQSRALMVLWNTLQNLAARYSAGDVAQAVTVPSEFPPEARTASIAQIWPLTAQLIAEMEREANACGAAFASFLTPPPELFALEGTPPDAIAALISAYEDTLRTLDIPHPATAWLLEPYRAHVLGGGSVWDLTWRRAAHYTALGYEWLAERLYLWLMDAQLTP